MHKESLFNCKVICTIQLIEIVLIPKVIEKEDPGPVPQIWRGKVSLVLWMMLLEETSRRVECFKKKKKKCFQTLDLIIYYATFISIISILLNRDFIVTHKTVSRRECESQPLLLPSLIRKGHCEKRYHKGTIAAVDNIVSPPVPCRTP